ncbi:VOC family protein [Sphingomonas sp. LaA6.9]|uniref:VOC family protein n=1 Tax=Sphingomonas sp. LaA6.9 TaxID=2919914 RepID=UPI001F4FA497|nr:VOC family protein [Sphingomonas sp. LaA6.9]MCJ8158556.1 VOC family protein [Sphingomonas sp. LaA6.9]
MSRLIRPDSNFSPSNGLLRADQFQIAYATNDIDAACAIFRNRFGIDAFRRLEGPLPAGGRIRVELAWVGTVMYELLTASGPGSALYMDRVPDNGFAIRHHHLGLLIHDAAQWAALAREAERVGTPLLNLRHNEGFMRTCFVDAPTLGHYLEYIFPEPAGLEFLNAVPGN